MNKLLPLLILISAQLANAQNIQQRLDSLGRTILEESGTLGSYVSVNSGDSVIFSSAFGYDDFHTKSPINDSTIFPISSNTKAFNSILLSQLVEQEKLDFTEPLKTYLPELELENEYVTSNINAIDLLTHRWGYPRYDFTYYLMSPEEKENGNSAVFNKLKHLESTSPFRTRFQYGNNQYILAAYLLEQIENTKWEKQLENKLLSPLQMSDTHCNLDLYKKSQNKSQGYQNKKTVDISLASPLYDVSGMGNMFSSIRDLRKWTQFLLKGNDSILPKELIDYNLTGHFNVGYEEPYDGFSSMDYGLGWFLFDYFGHKVVLHHGDGVGHQSLIVLLPDDDLSWVIVANEGMKRYGFPFTMTYSMLDLFLEQEANDWSSVLLAETNDPIPQPDSLSTQATPATLDIDKYQGEYTHEGFGTIRIYLLDDQLMIEAGAYSDELDHHDTDEFIAYSEEYQSGASIVFVLDEKNEIKSLRTDLIEPGVPFIEFKKRL